MSGHTARTASLGHCSRHKESEYMSYQNDNDIFLKTTTTLMVASVVVLIALGNGAIFTLLPIAIGYFAVSNFNKGLTKNKYYN